MAQATRFHPAVGPVAPSRKIFDRAPRVSHPWVSEIRDPWYSKFSLQVPRNQVTGPGRPAGNDRRYLSILDYFGSLANGRKVPAPIGIWHLQQGQDLTAREAKADRRAWLALDDRGS